jgi:hypothetical protein
LQYNVRKIIETADAVFIAYSHSDRRIARQFYRAVVRLRKRRPISTVFYDEFNIEPSARVSRSDFEEELRASTLFIVLCGADTHRSPEVNREIALALECGIDILPVTLKTKIQFPPRLDFSVQAISLDRLFYFRRRQQLLMLSIVLVLVATLASALYIDHLRRDYVKRSTIASNAAQNFVDGDFPNSLELSLQAFPKVFLADIPENFNPAPILLTMSYNQIINGPDAKPASRAAYLNDTGVTLQGIPRGTLIYYTIPASPHPGDRVAFDQLAVSPDNQSVAVIGDDPLTPWGDRWLFVLRPNFSGEYQDVEDTDMQFSQFPGRKGSEVASITLPGYDSYAELKPYKSSEWKRGAFDIYRPGRSVDQIEVKLSGACEKNDCAFTSLGYLSNSLLLFGLGSGELVAYDTRSRDIVWHRTPVSCKADGQYSPPDKTSDVLHSDCAAGTMVRKGSRLYVTVANGTVIAVSPNGAISEPTNDNVSDTQEMTNGSGEIYAHRKSDYCEANEQNAKDCSAFDAWVQNGNIKVLRKDYVLTTWLIGRANPESNEANNIKLDSPASTIAASMALKSNDLLVTTVKHLQGDAFVVEWTYEEMKGFSVIRKREVLFSSYNYGGTVAVEAGRAYLTSGTEAYEIALEPLKRIWGLDKSELPSAYSKMKELAKSQWVDRRLAP